MSGATVSGLGHNGGPPLEEHTPEWGDGNALRYFAWKGAHTRAWKSVSREVMLRRQRRAEAIGLTYEEYTLEILERGRYLSEGNRDRVEAIKAARKRPGLVGQRAGLRAVEKDIPPRAASLPLRASS